MGYCNLKTLKHLKNGKTISIRIAHKDDSEKLIKYFNNVGGESNNLLFGENEFSLTVEQEEEYIEKMKNDENSLMIIALDGEAIISSAQISCYKRSRIAHNAETSISVKKDYWNIGVGKEMLSVIVDFAKENNSILNVCLSVNSDNSSALNLYRKFGFEVVGRHKRNFKVSDIFVDEILMDLNL